MEIYFTGLTSRMMFDFAISAGSKQKERKKERQLQAENRMKITYMYQVRNIHNLPFTITEISCT